MGSEGYLINQFIAPRTNQRNDDWGGAFENRIRFAVEIVRRTREAVGPKFIIIYRLSMLDLVDGGSTWDEVVALARAIEAAGATLINTGIGWHEARIPTIATIGAARRVHLGHGAACGARSTFPLVTTNRINDPEVAEAILARGDADMVSMARPFLADPDFVAKAPPAAPSEINTCIACNQACLDHIFERKIATCLVNPRACRETELTLSRATRRASASPSSAPGPAGLACATTAAERGHAVTLFDAAPEIGGQFNLARRIPGQGGVRRDAALLSIIGSAALGVERAARRDVRRPTTCATPTRSSSPPASCRAHRRSTASTIRASSSYVDVLEAGATVGRNVAIIGAGGIGFDVAEFLTHAGGGRGHASDGALLDPAIAAFRDEWGVDADLRAAGRRESRRRAGAAAQRLAAAAQVDQGRRRSREDHRLDPPHAAATARREDAVRRALRAHRRRRPAHPRRRRAAGAGGRHDRPLRGPGAAPRSGASARGGAASRSR